MPYSSPRARRTARCTAFALLLSSAVAFPAIAQDTPDAAAMARIRDEGFNHSQVMNIESWLTDVYGPRLTGSPYTREAADWVIKQLTESAASLVYGDPEIGRAHV